MNKMVNKMVNGKKMESLYFIAGKTKQETKDLLFWKVKLFTELEHSGGYH